MAGFHWSRALWVTIAALVVAIAAWQLRETGGTGWMPGCIFKNTTGLDCPGCGMTRAANATLHGDLTAAFRFNPVGMVLLPIALLGLGLETLGWVRGKPLPYRFIPGKGVAITLAAVVILWWIGRNLFWKL